MKDMDYRLDLYNAVGNYIDNASEHDALLVVTYNSKQGDYIFAIYGDNHQIPQLLASNDFREQPSMEEVESLLEIRETILNTAICLITYDKELRTMFTNAINKMNEEEKKSTQIKQDA